MVTLRGIYRTLRITKSPLFIISLKILHKRAFVTFKNKSKFMLSWSDFLLLRDTYHYWSKYSVQQLDEKLFRVTSKHLDFTGNLILAKSIFELTEKHQFTIKQNNDGDFVIYGNAFTLVGSSEIISPIQEFLSGIYDCDCHQKTVLDIGGLEGETATYFYSRGAKKIILYEPIPDNFKKAQKNMEINGVNSELHKEGIGEFDGLASIEYASRNANNCTIKNVASVILESGAEIAKIDCEGAEESLINVSNDILKKVQLYIIETHSSMIKKRILEKFRDADFSLTQDYTLTKEISVLHFQHTALQ